MPRRLAILFLLLALPGLSGRAEDVLVLEGGRELKGRIVSENEAEIVVESAKGIRQTVPRESVVEVRRDYDPRAEFRQRLGHVAAGDARGFFDLGRWCEQRQLAAEAREAYLKAIAADPFYQPAREALGHRLYKGKWYSLEEYNEQILGLVPWEGTDGVVRWVTPEERDLYRAGFVKGPDGRWVRLEDLERQKEEARLEAERQAEARAPAGGKEKAPTPRPRIGVDEETLKARQEVERRMYGDFEGQVAWDQAPVLDTPHYRIRSNVKPDYTRIYGRMMETYFEKFEKVFVAPGDRFAEEAVKRARSEIFIYGSQEQFMSATGMGQGTGGFYSSGTKRVTAYHGSFGMTGNTRTVLSHEGTHQFQDLVLGMGFYQAPIWLIEGLAVFFESAFFDGQKVQIGTIPVDRLTQMKRAVAGRQTVPLRELLDVPQSRFTAFHYAHAWSFIHMMIYYAKTENIRKRNQQAFSALFFGCRQKRLGAQDVIEMFGGADKFNEVEQEWLQYIKDLPYDFKGS